MPAGKRFNPGRTTVYAAEQLRNPPVASGSNELRYEDYLTDSHRPGFDGLRALGFLLVITAHIPSVPFFVALQGWAAVWIFLTMSGYLITMLLMREERRAGRIAYGPFLVKRFCRIVPAYAAAIMIYGLACYAVELSPGDYDSFVQRLPYFVAFLPEYANRDGFSIFTHAWTVGVEVKFYLFFPPLVFILIRSSNWRMAISALSIVLLTAIGSFRAQSYCALMSGVMLALVLERPRGYAFVARLTRAPPIVPLILIVACVGILNFAATLTLVVLVATYVLAYAIVQQASVSGLLTWRPLVYLGQRAYGAYLLHFLAIRCGYRLFGDDTATGGILTAVFCLAVTVPAAALMFRAVELPIIAFGQQMLRTGPRPAGSGSPG